MLTTGRVLVVTDDPDAADFLTASLALDGYDTEMMDNLGAIGGPILALGLVAAFSVRTAILLFDHPGPARDGSRSCTRSDDSPG